MVQLRKILLKDVMVTKPYTIRVDEPFSRVWDKFRRYRIRHLPVVNKSRQLQGIITQRDLYKIISPRKTMDGNFIYDRAELDRYILKHVMKKKVTTLSPNDFLGQAIDIMVNFKYGCIPVIDVYRCRASCTYICHIYPYLRITCCTPVHNLKAVCC